MKRLDPPPEPPLSPSDHAELVRSQKALGPVQRKFHVDGLWYYWEMLAPGSIEKEHGKRCIRQWLSRYPSQEITTAMDIATVQYITFGKDDTADKESCRRAFDKIKRICRMRTQDPSLLELYYIRGILQNRCHYFNEWKAMQILKNAISCGVTLDELRGIAKKIRNWTHFSKEIDAAIKNRVGVLAACNEDPS